MIRFRPAAAPFVTVFAAALVLAALAAAPATAGETKAPGATSSNPPVFEWHAPGPEAAARAEQDGKPILYFFTAEWCAPCHHLKRTVFADPEKAATIVASFVPVEVQDTRVETGKNAPEVDEAIERYRVSSLPTMVVALPDGEEVANQSGYAGAARAWMWLQMQAKAAEAALEDE